MATAGAGDAPAALGPLQSLVGAVKTAASTQEPTAAAATTATTTTNQLGDEQLSSAKVESEIPDELKEYPIPESLSALDKHMDAHIYIRAALPQPKKRVFDSRYATPSLPCAFCIGPHYTQQLIEDIRILIDARNKEFMVNGETRSRMPILPSINNFENYKARRKDNLEGILKVEMPSRKIGSSELIQKEMKRYWSVDEMFESERMLESLMSFFKEKAQRQLHENELLMSRWVRFCRTSYDANRFYYLFNARQEHLLREFTDSADRYERLYIFNQQRAQKLREKNAAEDAARIDAERRGLAVLKDKYGAAQGKRGDLPGERNEKDRLNAFSDEMSFFGPPELGENPGFDIQDLAVYLRWLSAADKERLDVNIFLNRAKLITHADRRQLLSDYHVLTKLTPGAEAVEDLEHFEGLSVFINNQPIKTAKVEDFITEYDILVSHWGVETAINQEDGRPFAYEIDHKFFENFSEQTMEVSLAPYEILGSINENNDSAEKTATSHFSGNSGIDALIASLSSVSGYSQKSNQKISKFPKLRHATWTDNIILVPEFDSWQEAYRHTLQDLRNTDMELRLEHDLLLSQDHEHVGAQLKDIAKRVWERSAQIPNSRPLSIKVSIIPQQREYKPKDAGESRQNREFDFGLQIPSQTELAPESTVLASKKRDYGMVLIANEDNRRLELELQNADPSHIIDGANIVTPTISTIFAEHEVFAYLQMRLIKIREVRIKVLRQFNFLRSVEKRLNMDLQASDKQFKRQDLNNPNVLVAQMWRRAEFLDIGANSENSTKTKPAADAPNQTAQDYLKEDFPAYDNGKIQLTDEKGVSFVYDAAMTDLEEFENEMLKILTHYINEGRADDHVSHEYVDELRFRMANRRTEALSVTYYNPQADRSQMMLEFYEAHVRYQYAKTELINAYLEAYEHTNEIDRSREIAQIVTNIMHCKPSLDFKNKYFGGCYALATRAFELHAQLVLRVMRHTVSTQRVWCRRYTPRSSPHRKSSMSSFANDKSSDNLANSGRRYSESQSPVSPDAPITLPPLSSLNASSSDPKKPEAYYDSILKIGLPIIEGSESQSIVIHHPEMSVNLTEIFPGLENVIHIWNVVKSVSNDLGDVIDTLIGSKNRVSKKISDCVALRSLNLCWSAMADFNFQMPVRARRIVGNLDSNVWLQNPYLCDALLNEYYVPYDQTDEGTYKSLGVQLSAPSFYTDASFQQSGREILQRAAKTLVLRRRLVNIWMESENWRKAYEDQFIEMGVNKASYCGRLAPLRFEAGGAASDGALDETAEPDDADDEIGMDNVNVSESEDELHSVTRESNMMRYGPLAISELDETLAVFDLSSLSGVTNLMRPQGMTRLKLGIKIQLLDRSWFMASVDIHGLVLGEIHLGVIEGRQARTAEERTKIAGNAASNAGTAGGAGAGAGAGSSAGTSAGGTSAASRGGIGGNTDEAQGNDRYDIDYRTLLTTNLSKKKLLRRILLSEFSKEYKSLKAQEVSEAQQEQALVKFKARLIDWYHANMFEVVAEECERAEFAKLISEMRKTAASSPHGKLLFLFSNITRHADYFAGVEDASKENDKTRFKQSVQTQEIVSNESVIAPGGDTGTGGDRLARLWYLPHLTEIMLAMSAPDKPHKGPIDLSHRIFRNQQIFLKSIRIHSIVYELYTIVTVFSHLLQNNRRYAASIKQLRESDYIVSTINLIKRDLTNQGEPAEYARVLNFLNSRWQFWFLKLKYALSLSIHTLEMNMFPSDRTILAAHYEKCMTKKFSYLRKPKRGRHEKPLQMSKAAIIVTRTFIPTFYVFGNISTEGKRLCDSKVQEIEEGIEEYFQAIQFSGSEKDMNKSLMDYLTSNIKLLALRREFFKIMTENKLLTDEAMQFKCFQKYKMRILVPSVRQYHKLGSKGSASTNFLLQDDMITGNVAIEFNRIARSAFERCQLTILQNEILRDYTAHVLRDAQEYFDQLTDERLGRLFRANADLVVPSVTNADELSFYVSEEDYNTKMAIFNTFLSDLHHASTEFLQDLRDKQTMAPMLRTGKHQAKVEDPTVVAIFDDKRIFACKKEFLGQSIVRLATQLNEWKRDRVADQERFTGALYGRLLEAVRNCERIILFQAQEKRDIMVNFKREARMLGHDFALDTYSELSSMSVELGELRKNRRMDERRIRHKILDEYDGLVQELVKEIGVLRHRFREYQIGNLNDVTNIMAEAKKEQLAIMVQNTELPHGMRDTARTMIEHEERLATLREQNHELKMTVLKIRSMFSMKEQAHKFTYDRQFRKLLDASKEAEEKLWDSYRDAEARERALRKQMGKLQKTKSGIEFQNELLQRQLRDEQNKPRGNTAIKAATGVGGSGSAGPGNERSQSKMSRTDKNKKEVKSQKLTELEDRLRRYEGINIDNLIQELANKTALVEELIQEKRDRDKQTKRVAVPDKDASRRVKSARWNRTHGSSRSPSPAPDTNALISRHMNASTASRAETARTSRTVIVADRIASRASGATAASAAEPSQQPISSHDRSTIELNSQMFEKLHELMRENKALRRKLFLNGITLPPESRNVMYLRSGYGTPRNDSGVATSVYNSRVASPDRSRPRTAVASGGNTIGNNDRRRSAGILRNSMSALPSDINGVDGTEREPGMENTTQKRFSIIPNGQQQQYQYDDDAERTGSLPRLETTPVYQRVGGNKQVGFAGQDQLGNVGATPAFLETLHCDSLNNSGNGGTGMGPHSRRGSMNQNTNILSVPGDPNVTGNDSSRQRPQTAPANRRVSFTS